MRILTWNIVCQRYNTRHSTKNLNVLSRTELGHYLSITRAYCIGILPYRSSSIKQVEHYGNFRRNFGGPRG